MKRTYSILAAMILATTASAQIGAPYIHDPSTIAECEGKYYTFGTGGGVEDSSLKMVGHGTAVLNALEEVRLPI